MDLVLCIVLGYLLGSLNPAALIGKIKHFNLRKHGTGNLGATNVLLNFGKGFAAVVMLFDIFKAFAAFHLASLFCGGVELAPYLAGAAAVLALSHGEDADRVPYAELHAALEQKGVLFDLHA